MPLPIPPKAKTGMMAGRDLDRAGQLLYRYYTFYQGVSLVKKAGIWSTIQGIALEDIIHTYENYFLGGHEYEIDQATADELTAQGFGQYIDPDDGGDDDFGYGEGGYGEGPYGN